MLYIFWMTFIASFSPENILEEIGVDLCSTVHPM